MSVFEVKNPIQRGVLNFSYKKATDIYNYLTQHFDQDAQRKLLSCRHWSVSESKEISKYQRLQNIPRHMLQLRWFNANKNQCSNEFPDSEYSDSDTVMMVVLTMTLMKWSNMN